MTLGEKLLKLRKARQWSQEELAERIGVTRQAVSRWESDSAKPDADKIVTMCELFGVSADYLLGTGNAKEEEVPQRFSLQPQNHSGVVSGILCLGIVLTALGILVLLALVAMSVWKPHWYGIGDKIYSGLAGFLLGNHLVWLMVADGAVLVLGLILLLWGCLLHGWIARKNW